MKIETYNGRFDNEIIALILSIQNDETKIGLSLQEQPDLLDIQRYYQWPGGEFWVALSDDRVIGTIVLMLKEKNCDVLKNFLWRRRFAHKKVWLSLYNEFLKYANSKGIEHIILDTPAVAHISHRFYEKAGFKRINSEELSVSYSYPDRDSILYMLNL